jgi:hypothetical protein
MELERAPRKLGGGGANQVMENETRLTMAFRFPQFTHIFSRIFFTLTMKPGESGRKQFKLYMRRCEETHLDENRPCQLDVPETTGAFRHPFTTRLTLEIPVDSAHSEVYESNHFRFVSGLVQDGRFWQPSRFSVKMRAPGSTGVMEPKYDDATHDFLRRKNINAPFTF